MDLTAGIRGSGAMSPSLYLQKASAGEAGGTSSQDATLSMERALSDNRFLKDRIKLLLSATRASTPALQPWLLTPHDEEKKDRHLSPHELNPQGRIQRVLDENHFLKDQLHLILIEEQWLKGKLDEPTNSTASPERQPSAARAQQSQAFRVPVPPSRPEVVTSQPVLWTVMTDTDGDAGTDPTSLFSARRSPKAANKNSSMPLLLPTTDIPPGLYGSIPLFTSTVSEKIAFEDSTELHVKIFSMSSIDAKSRITNSDPFIKITVGKISYRTRIKHNPEGECLEVVGVNSNVYSFQRENNARMLEVILYDTHDVLAEGNIDLRKQTYSDVEHLRTFVHGVPFTIVNSKSGKAYVVYLAFGATVKRAKVVHAHVVQDTQNGNQDARSPSNKVDDLKKLLEREHELRILQQIENDHMRKLDADVMALQTQLLQVRSNTKLENGPGMLSTSSQAPSSGLELGIRVMVHSLNAKPEYNGQLGKVIMFLEGDRAGVTLDKDPKPMHSFHISKLLPISHLAQEQRDGRQEISRSPQPIVQPASLSPRTTAQASLSPRTTTQASLSPRTTASLHSRLDQVLNSIDRKPQACVPEQNLMRLWIDDLTFFKAQEGVHLPSDRRPQGAQVVPLHRQAWAINAGNVPVGGNSLLAPVQIESMGGRSTGGESTRLPVDPTMSPSLSPPSIRGPGNRERGSADLTAPLAVVPPKAGSKDATMSPLLSSPPVRGPGNREGGSADLTAPLAVVTKAGSKVDPSSHAKAPEVTMQVHVRVFGVSGFKSTAGWMDKTDPFVKLILGKEEHKTAVKKDAGGTVTFDETFSFTLPVKNKSVYSPSSANLSSIDVQSLLKDRGDTILKVLVYDSDTLSSDLLGQSEINLSDQPDAFVRIEDLGSLSRGMPYAMVDSKTGREQGTVHLAFAVTRIEAAVGEEPYFSKSSHRHSAVQTHPSVDSAVQTHPSDAGPDLQIGTQVRVHSMNAATEYNGKIGTVIQLLETGRVGVLLKDDPDSMVIFKSSKLEVIPFKVGGTTFPSLSSPPVRGPGNREGGSADLTAPLAVVTKTGSKVDPSSHAKAPEVTMQVHVRVFGVSGFKSTAGWMDKTDPFVKLILGKEEHKTAVKKDAGGTVTFDETFSFTLPVKNKSVYSPSSANLSSIDVQSLLKDRGDTILKVLVYDSDTLSSDLLGQSEINLSDQPDAFVRIEDLGSLSRGMPYAMVDSKTGREQGTVHLAFAVTRMHSTVGESTRLPVDEEAKAPKPAVYIEERASLPPPENGRNGRNCKDSYAGTPDVLADAVGALNQAPQVVIQLGSRVCLHSLHQVPQYNGELGTVVKVLDAGRIGVLLDKNPNAIISLKPENAAIVYYEVMGEAENGKVRGGRTKM